ncbi:MAG: SCO family protein [Magnetococcales bacterium]|nr:SCO family protein [Magnetococcales bacterium]
MADTPPDIPTKKSISLRMAMLMFLGVALVSVAIKVGLHWSQIPEKRIPADLQRVLLPTPREIPNIKLVHHDKSPFTPEQFKGKWDVLFFGYTHCPDVCPMALGRLSEVFAILEKREPHIFKKLQGIFVSVDPKRDTAEHLAEYVSYFHDGFVGVTGEAEQIKLLARAVGAGYFIQKPDKDGNYEVNHTTSLFLVDPTGQYVGAISPDGVTPETMAAMLVRVHDHFEPKK